MNEIYFSHFNANLTLLGGQAFNWEKEGKFYYGVFSDFILKIKYEDEKLFWTSSKDIDETWIRHLFGIEENYQEILLEISKDPVINEAVGKYHGLRILKQPFEQTLISFIVSQNSNIPKIKRSLQLISKIAGKKEIFDGKEFYLFPKLQDLKDFTEQDFKECGVGYRAKYLVQCIKETLEKNLHQRIGQMTLSEARSELIKMHGIGEKVADCILVFSLRFYEITPLDLWARRAFTQTYNLPEKIKYKDLLEFINNKFGKNTAWSGQYLFEYYRLKKSQS